MSNFSIKATKLPKHTREFEVLANWEYVASVRDAAFAEIAKDISVPGFRVGQAPKSMVARYINPEKLYDKTARKILPEIYKELIDTEKINPVTTPSVDLLEAKDNELWKFKVTVAEIPEVKIKDYKKKIAALHDDVRAKTASAENEKSIKVKSDKKAKASLQDIFKILLEESEVEIPDLLIAEEVGRRMEQLTHDVKRVGLTEEQYLASKNLKLDELKEQHSKDAIEMYRLEFILAEIAKNEGIKVEASELDVLMTGAKTDKEREIAAQNMEWYAGILRKQKVLDFLNDL